MFYNIYPGRGSSGRIHDRHLPRLLRRQEELQVPRGVCSSRAGPSKDVSQEAEGDAVLDGDDRYGRSTL